MRLGIIGGTFDPIHCGHLDAAVAARQACRLDRILFIPARVPPHRSRSPLASPFHRFAMTAIAVLGDEGFAASDLELARPGPSFSVDTLRALKSDGWHGLQLFFIMGVDAFAEIETWRDYPHLLDESQFVVVTRPGHEPESLRQRLPQLASRFIDANDPRALNHALAAEETSLFIVDAPTANVSSTEVRRRLAIGESLTGLVPGDVERYIHQYKLYDSIAAAPQLHGQD